MTDFSELVMPALMQHEAENQIMLGMLNNPAAMPSPFEVMISIHRGGKVIGAATKNLGSEYKLILSPLADIDFDNIAIAVNEQLDSPLIGVLGVTNTAEGFAKAWAKLHHTQCHTLFRQGIYTCSEVHNVPAAPGAMRAANLEDLEIILKWRKLFIAECGLEPESDAFAKLRTENTIKNSWLRVWVPSSFLSEEKR